MESLTLKPYVDTKSGMWHVTVRFKDSKWRVRPSLGVPGDQDPSEAVKAFRRDVLPVLMEQNAERMAEPKEPSKQSPGPTLTALADWYLETHLPFMGKHPKTINEYRRAIDSLISYCSGRHIGRAQQLTARTIQEWQIQRAKDKALDTGPNRDQVLAVRRWLTVCQEAGELRELPSIQWQIPPKKKSRRFRAIDHDTITAWVDGLEAWRPQAGWIARWVALTGWRIGDAQDLRIGEVDTKAGTIDRDQLKTEEGLPWPIVPAMVDLCERAMVDHPDKDNPDAHVFLDRKHRPWDYQRLVKLIANYEKTRWDGPHITFRDLRKSFGSRLAMGGCPPNVLKELMGHQSIELTLGYYVNVDRERMAEWMKWTTASRE